MLVELVVENYAVIERVRVRFHRGLNLLTGETGSGKSIVVDALGLLFGGRASAEMVRTGADRSRLSGIFEVPDSGPLRDFLDAAGIATEDGELLVEREILAGGKSRAFAGSRPVTAAVLRDLAPFLGDIHGQHDQQQLFSARAQLDMLDAFASNEELVSEVNSIYARWRSCAQELEELEHNEQEKLRLADLWSFQRKEIEAADLKAGADATLENELRVLNNVARLEENANIAYSALYDAEHSVLAQMRIAKRRLEEVAKIDLAAAEILEALRPAEIGIEEASLALRDYLGKLEADPARLETVVARLASIDKLKRKYGSTVDEILAFLAEVRGNLESLESSGERRAALRKQQAELETEYRSKSAVLTGRRKEAGRKLEKRICSELAALAMERTVFQVRITEAGWSESGEDAIAFLVSPNVGEEPRALERVASGGEISRIALALKTSIVSGGPKKRTTSAPLTLVFDEVDAGIGGGAAETVGRRLKQLAASNQVLCVTHLPQIAGFADHHYAVEKHEERGRTVAVLEELEGEARTREIGRMLSGQRLTPEALRHAEQLIKQGSE